MPAICSPCGYSSEEDSLCRATGVAVKECSQFSPFLASVRDCLKQGLLVVFYSQIKALRWLPGASALLSWTQQPAVTQALGLARHLEWSGCVWYKTSRCVRSECLLMYARMVSFIMWIQGMDVNVNVELYPTNWGRIPWVLEVYWLSITQVFPADLSHPFCAVTSSLLLVSYICQQILWLNLPSPQRKNDPWIPADRVHHAGRSSQMQQWQAELEPVPGK